jgi:hypothetical protein
MPRRRSFTSQLYPSLALLAERHAPPSRRSRRLPIRPSAVLPSDDVSDFAPVRTILAREREQGRSFAEAWELALQGVEDKQEPGRAREHSGGVGGRVRT